MLTVRGVGTAFVVLAFAVPLLASRAGSESAAPRLWELSASRWAVAAMLLLSAVGTAMELSSPDRRDLGRGVVLGAGTLLLVTPALTIALLELVSVWISPDRLPRTLRRLSIGGDPRLGIWILAVGGGLILLSATTAPVSISRRLSELARSHGRSRIVAVGFASAAVAMLGVGRYVDWLTIDSTVGTWELPGNTLPWIGPMTLGLFAASVALSAVLLMRTVPTSAAATATLGWAVTLPAACMLIVTTAVPKVRAPDWLRERLVEWSTGTDRWGSVIPADLLALPRDLRVDLVPGAGLFLVLGAGLLLAAAGLLALRTPRDEGMT